jgi:hypothetical protein
MSTVSSPAALPSFISKLLSDRHAHVAAVAAIDATLSRVSAALGGAAPKVAPVKAIAKPVAKKPVKKAAPALKAPVVKAAVKAPVVKKAPAVKAKKTGLTANDFVLGFVKDKKNPTSQEINKAWKDAGRKGMADNNLSLLTKIKKLKRVPLGEGIRGSRYSIA